MSRLVTMALVGVLSGGACHLVADIEEGVPLCAVDGVQNPPETDIDCGGPCSPCPDGARCLVDEDCQSLSCPDFGCVPATCFDGIRNGLETDVDCGGDTPEGAVSACPRCLGGETCRSTTDCASHRDGSEAGVCAGLEEGPLGTCAPLCCLGDCEGCSSCTEVCDNGWGEPCAAEDLSACEFPLICFYEPGRQLACR